jgi:lipopolysaccharide export system protein LptA
MNKAALCVIAVGFAAAAPFVFAKDAKPQAAPATPKAAPASPGDDIGFSRGGSGTPLDVTADQGIEFSKDAKEIIARVNAKAVRGNTTVTADVLTAYYRDKTPPAPGATPAGTKSKAPGPAPATTPPPPAPAPGATPKAAPAETPTPSDAPNDGTGAGGSEVWRVTADGNVDIFTPTQHAYGDHGDYNIDDAVVVLTGDHLKMTTPQDVVTARDTLEYWENKHQAVARGNAVAVHAEKRIQADVLVADFAPNKQNQMEIQIVHGYDHVVLTTTNDVVTGDRADYVVETGIVTVTGSVKMTRENNQLNGGYAVVNLNTGISRLYPAPPGGKAVDRQVRGLFVPQPKKAPVPATDTAPKGP